MGCDVGRDLAAGGGAGVPGEEGALLAAGLRDDRDEPRGRQPGRRGPPPQPQPGQRLAVILPGQRGAASHWSLGVT